MSKNTKRHMDAMRRMSRLDAVEYARKNGIDIHGNSTRPQRNVPLPSAEGLGRGGY